MFELQTSEFLLPEGYGDYAATPMATAEQFVRPMMLAARMNPESETDRKIMALVRASYLKPLPYISEDLRAAMKPDHVQFRIAQIEARISYLKKTKQYRTGLRKTTEAKGLESQLKAYKSQLKVARKLTKKRGEIREDKQKLQESREKAAEKSAASVDRDLVDRPEQMEQEESDTDTSTDTGTDQAGINWLLVGTVGLAALGVGAYFLMRKKK